MNNINYQKELEKIINQIEKKDVRPRLLLHVCCAPCSSYVLEYLSPYFDITAYFYNPNIASVQEYDHRISELKRFVKEKNFETAIGVEDGYYTPEEFYGAIKGLEDCREGGDRCFKCYELRLEHTARKAKEEKYDFFTTTLTISPLKNAAKLNQIGSEMGEKYGVDYLYSDFKKKNGYKRSVELSKEYNLYRQNFCGCVFSR